MKSTPPLENYDGIVRLIKNAGKVRDESFEPETTDLIGNYILYPIWFNKKQSSIHTLLPKVHSYSPLAAAYFELVLRGQHQYEKHIPGIERKLQITGEKRSYHWSVQADVVLLLIKVQGKKRKPLENEKLIAYCYQILHQENENCIEKIQYKVLRSKKEKEAEIYIQKLHQQITSFLRKLSDRIHPVNIVELFELSDNLDKLDCLKVVYMFAAQIVSRIETDYFLYINKHNGASVWRQYQTQILRKAEIEFLQSALKNRNINKQMAAIVLLPVNLMNNQLYGKTISYAELEFCDQYCMQLFQQLSNEFREPLETELILFMIASNLNSLHFFGYYSTAIKNEIEVCDSSAQKLEVLFGYAKSIKQVVYKRKSKFRKNLPSIKVQLLNWISEEAKYIEKKMMLSTIQTDRGSTSTTKISSGLSVAQIGYFCGLLCRAGIIESDNISNLLRIVCDNFKTAKTENISPESLRQRYYNVELGTMEAVHEKLNQLIELTKTQNF